jgi:hypothetical protein
MNTNEKVNITIPFQGKPIVNHAYFTYKNSKVTLICVDMKSKHSKISAIGGGKNPCILLEADENTDPININLKDNNELTQIDFIDFNHTWNVFNAEIAKYTIFITLIKGNSK